MADCLRGGCVHLFAAEIRMAEEVGDNVEWNVALEEIIKKEGEQAEGLYWLHNCANRWAQQRNDWIALPAIVLATVTGFFSATSDLMPPIAVGALSVLVGVLNTINSYYKFSQRAEGHRITSLWYLKTYKSIECQLSLPHSQRDKASDLLNNLRDNMARVSETAPLLPQRVINEYKVRFKDEKAHKPIEANGLDEIKIFRGEIEKTPSVVAATPRPQIKVTLV